MTCTHASLPIPELKAHPTECVMHAPTTVTCVIDTVATTYTANLKPALGQVAPAALVAVDGSIEYLALIRAKTIPADRQRELVSLLSDI